MATKEEKKGGAGLVDHDTVAAASAVTQEYVQDKGAESGGKSGGDKGKDTGGATEKLDNVYGKSFTT